MLSPGCCQLLSVFFKTVFFFIAPLQKSCKELLAQFGFVGAFWRVCWLWFGFWVCWYARSLARRHGSAPLPHQIFRHTGDDCARARSRVRKVACRSWRHLLATSGSSLRNEDTRTRAYKQTSVVTKNKLEENLKEKKVPKIQSRWKWFYFEENVLSRASLKSHVATAPPALALPALICSSTKRKPMMLVQAN